MKFRRNKASARASIKAAGYNDPFEWKYDLGKWEDGYCPGLLFNKGYDVAILVTYYRPDHSKHQLCYAHFYMESLCHKAIVYPIAEEGVYVCAACQKSDPGSFSCSLRMEDEPTKPRLSFPPSYLMEDEFFTAVASALAHRSGGTLRGAIGSAECLDAFWELIAAMDEAAEAQLAG